MNLGKVGRQNAQTSDDCWSVDKRLRFQEGIDSRPRGSATSHELWMKMA